MNKLLFALLTLVTGFGFPTQPISGASPPVRVSTYCNERFGYCIQYPPDLLYPQPEAGNGDGRVGQQFFVLSGTKKGKLFYEKMILIKDAFCYAILEYAPAEKTVYDSYCGQVFRSFK